MPEQHLHQRCAELSARYPVGTPCRYWPGIREGPGRLSELRTCFWVVGTHSIVASVKGYAGGIALTHLEFESLGDATSDAPEPHVMASPVMTAHARYADAASGQQRWDALDQLGDTPKAGETVHVYVLAGGRGDVHLCGRGLNGWYAVAKYRYCEAQPDRETGRDTEKWRAWAQAQVEAMQRAAT